MDEFGLIDDIVAVLGEESRAPWIEVAPGDDSAVVAVSAGCSAVGSIDTFLPNVHFPESALPEDVGFRVFMASASDLAAMAAVPRYALVAIALPHSDREYPLGLAKGMARAAREAGMAICGGNLSKGPLSITVSVHGEVKTGSAVLRSEACVGDLVQVSGSLGCAAACVRKSAYDQDGQLRDAYFSPKARLDLAATLADATAAIDISDGCLQDLSHIARASRVGISVQSALIPVGSGANLDDALWGGDDYELLATARTQLEGFTVIGEVVAGDQVMLDDKPVNNRGYDHFRA